MMSPTQDLPTLPSHRGLLGIAPDELDRFTATKPVQFLVGHDRAEFSIHPDLLSCLSAPLTTLINYETKGFLERYVTCENVDKDIFSRFVQFVYTGAYTGFPPAEKDRPAGQIEEVSDVTASVDEKLPDVSLWPTPSSPWPTNLTTQQGNVNHNSDSTVLLGALPRNDKDLFKLPYSLASYQRAAKQLQSGSRPSSKRKSDWTPCECGPYYRKQDFISAFVEKYNGANDGQIIWQTKLKADIISSAFIGHARVWVFADRFAIASLMDLAFLQLARDLTHWTILPSAFILGFGELVRYAYGSPTAEGSQLRQLVAQFAACVVEDVSGLKGWSTLLKEAPDFAADLVDQMTSRLG